MEKNKTGVRAGVYSVVATAVVVVIVILLNLIIGVLPTKYTQLDTSEKNIFTFDEKTETFMKNLSEDVTVYHVCVEGQENANLRKLLERYSELNRHLTVKQVDPAVNPAFLDKYTESAVANNSLIVESEKRAKVVPYSEISYLYSKDLDMKMDESTYQYYSMMFQQYYGQQLTVSEIFAGENAVVSAVDYVTTENLPKMYLLAGHDEYALYGAVTNWLETQNYVTEELTLSSADVDITGAITEKTAEIPADADAILICSPQKDLTTGEVKALSDYAAKGGSLIVLTDYINSESEQLRALADGFGLDISTGIVLEENGSNYTQYPYLLRPNVGSHAILSQVDSVLMPLAHGIREKDTLPAGMKVTTLLSTSDSAYAKPLGFAAAQATSLDREEGDIAGPFAIGALVEITDGGSVVWFSSDFCMTNTQYAQYYGEGACAMLTNSISYLCGKTETISVRTIDLSLSPLQVPAGSVAFFGILLIGVIPVGLIVTGLVIWIRRRSK